MPVVVYLDSMRMHVDGTIKRLKLREYVLNFNKPGGAKLSGISDFVLALRYDQKREAGYEEAREAAPGDNADFDECMRACLEPLIVSSLIMGVLAEGRIWASEAVSMDPLSVRAPVPFETEDEWVSWTLANVDIPARFCGPEGEDVVLDDAVEVILRQSLRAERVAATRNGWLPGPALVRLSERFPARNRP